VFLTTKMFTSSKEDSCRMERVIKCLQFVTNFISAKRNSPEVGLHHFYSELRIVDPDVSAVYGQRVCLKIDLCQNWNVFKRAYV